MASSPPDHAGYVQGAPVVEVRGVAKRFGATEAVSDASFSLSPGEFVTVLGPSGSGKSTLLSLIAGFETPDRGEIYLQGRPLSAVPVHRRPVGVVFQRLALFPHLSVAQNIAYPLHRRSYPRREIKQRVEAMLAVVRLQGLERRRIFELSGGQQQRVAIARALVFEPLLLLLDEPLASLDVKLKEDMQREFRRIQRSLGVTTLNVTHDQREALVMSDRIIVMNAARLQQIDTPVQVYHRPANPFVAQFIGLTNAWQADLLAVDGARATVALGGQTWTGRWGGGEPTPRAQCLLRAESLRLAPPGNGGLEGVIEEVIFEGDRRQYLCRVPSWDDKSLTAIAANPPTSADSGGEPGGDRVDLSWADDDLWLFPGQGAP